MHQWHATRRRNQTGVTITCDVHWKAHKLQDDDGQIQTSVSWAGRPPFPAPPGRLEMPTVDVAAAAFACRLAALHLYVYTTYRSYYNTTPGLYILHFVESQQMHRQLSSAQPTAIFSSTAQRRAVPCGAVPCPALRCCFVLRCAFFRTYSSTRYMMRRTRYEVPVCTCCVLYFAFFS